jgi:hypothetical protein
MQEKALFGNFYGNNAFNSKNYPNHNNGADLREKAAEKLTWAFQAIPTLYSVYQKVENTHSFNLLLLFLYGSFFFLNEHFIIILLHFLSFSLVSLLN